MGAVTNPDKAWQRLGSGTTAKVRRLAKKGRLHPHPEVRRVSVEWARHLRANRRRMLVRHLWTGYAAAICAVAVVYLLTVVVGWADGFPTFAGIFLVQPAMMTWFEFDTARRVAKIADQEGSPDE